MENRSVSGQNAHRKGIYREAINLKNNGWYVMADHIPDFDPPPEIEGYIPDIYALKNNKTYIIEIETSIDDDHQQHKAFREYSKHYSDIEFLVWIVNESGCKASFFQ